MLARFLAHQLACPTEPFGTWLLAPLWNWRNAALSDRALTALEPAPTDRILEIGFGGGYLLSKLASKLGQGGLAGVDISPAMVARARRRYPNLLRAGRLDLRCEAAEALPFDSGSFTKVCSVNSACYWRDIAAAFAECQRVLKARGRFVLCLTCPRSLANKGFAQHGLKLFESRQIESYLSAAGFIRVRTTLHADAHREFFCSTGEKASIGEQT